MQVRALPHVGPLALRRVEDPRYDSQGQRPRIASAKNVAALKGRDKRSVPSTKGSGHTGLRKIQATVYLGFSPGYHMFDFQPEDAARSSLAGDEITRLILFRRRERIRVSSRGLLLEGRGSIGSRLCRPRPAAADGSGNDAAAGLRHSRDPRKSNCPSHPA